jgi:AcrR family transcriptional regulator
MQDAVPRVLHWWDVRVRRIQTLHRVGIGRTSMRHVSSREALLRAAASVLADDGVSGLSLRRVAARAGFSHAAPGVVFGDRVGLLTAFAAEGFERFARDVELALDASGDPQHALRAVCAAYVQFAVEEPELFQLMFRPDLVRTHDETYRTASGKVVAAVRRAARCYADATGVSAEEVFMLTWSAAHGLATLWSSDHLAGRAPTADVLALAGIAADAIVQRLERGDA